MLIKAPSWCHCFNPGEDASSIADAVELKDVDDIKQEQPVIQQAKVASDLPKIVEVKDAVAANAPTSVGTSPVATPAVDTFMEGQKALHEAARQNRIELLHQLVHEKRVPVDAADQQARTTLHIAAAAGSVAAVRQLIQLGADVNAVDQMGRTPFLAGAFSHKADVLPLLREANVDMTVRDNEGNTALHLACWNGNIPAVKFLLENGASVHNVNQDFQTPLHKAAEQNEFEVINRLVWAGAVVDAQDQIGNTPLHIAARLGNTDVTRYLLRHGAKLAALNKSKKTPGDVALDQDMRRMLMDLEAAELAGHHGPQAATNANIKASKRAPSTTGSIAPSVKSLSTSVSHSVEHPRTPSFGHGRRAIDAHSSLSMDDISIDLSIQESTSTKSNVPSTQSNMASAHSNMSSTRNSNPTLLLDSFVHPREMDQGFTILHHETYTTDPALYTDPILIASNASHISPALMRSTPNVFIVESPRHDRRARQSLTRTPSPTGRAISPLNRSISPSSRDASPLSRGISPLRSSSPTPSTRTSSPIRKPMNKLSHSDPTPNLKLTIPSRSIATPTSTARQSATSQDAALSFRTNTPVSHISTPAARMSPRRARQYTPTTNRSSRDASPLGSSRSRTSSHFIKTPTSATSSHRRSVDLLSTHRSSASEPHNAGSAQAKSGHAGARLRRTNSTPARAHAARTRPVDIPEDAVVNDVEPQRDQTREKARQAGVVQGAAGGKVAGGVQGVVDELQMEVPVGLRIRTSREGMGRMSSRGMSSRGSVMSSRASVRSVSLSPLRSSCAKEAKREEKKNGWRPPGVWVP